MFLAGFSCIALMLLFSACTYQRGAYPYQELSLAKQKQKISFLQKKLQRARKEEEKVHDTVERLAEEVMTAQLNLIRREIDDYEDDLRKLGKQGKRSEVGELFLKERELLHRMIQTGASSFEAQLVLDRILQLITELSDAASD